MSSAGATGGGAKRPKTRRADIGLSAGALFAARGFHSVRMDDIAQASGITARALYRHYANKQALLSHVVHEDQARLVELLTGFDATPPADLGTGLRRLVETALQSLRLSLLWQREARHLGPDDYAAVRARTRWIADRIDAVCVAPARPDLDPYLTELRSWAVIGLVTSPGHYDTSLSTTRLTDLLVQAATRLVHCPAGRAPDPDGGREPVDRLPTSRRELLLRAAARTFRRRGYGGVTIDEIGGAAGVVGPALYRYFDTKADLLVAVATRFGEWSALETSRALRLPVPDDEVVTALVDGYVRLSVEETDLASVSITERLYLPPDVDERLNRMAGDTVGEWLRRLGAARPDLPETEALTLVNAARTTVDGIVRIPHLRADRRFAPELARLTGAVLGLPSGTA
ncbi:TetR/AcrR family transcriptional regulator [Pseudonocardia sp. NPDC046786]|uniref:TetR/AcrR family transcriptional regulator n=1 Tax=Pseudonocardia sp. NPDC046786 TaxID=3155471 RepID=UPI0033DBF2BC